MNAEQIDILLSSKKSEDRIRAVNVSGSLSDEEKLPILLKALLDKSNYVAALAAKSLCDCADSDALTLMLARFDQVSTDGLRHDPGCHIRASLAFTFGRLEYMPAVLSLRKGIRTVQIEAVGGVPFDTGAHLRANCALALAQLGDRESLRDISLLLFDMSSPQRNSRDAVMAKLELRKSAAHALAILGDRLGCIPLSIKLTYPENELPEVLQECMQSLVALEDERILDVLSPFLQDLDTGLSGYAALMLASTGTKETLDLLKQTVDISYGEHLKFLIIAFSTHRSEQARDYLIAQLRSERKELRKIVRETLSDSMDEVTKSALAECEM